MALAMIRLAATMVHISPIISGTVMLAMFGVLWLSHRLPSDIHYEQLSPSSNEIVRVLTWLFWAVWTFIGCLAIVVEIVAKVSN
jgi:hypothetical protein